MIISSFFPEIVIVMIKLGWQFIFNVLHNNGNRWGNLSIKYMAFSSLQNEQKRDLFLWTWTIRKCHFCTFYKHLRIYLYCYEYIFRLTYFIVHEIKNGYAMIYFCVFDIMMKKSISGFTIYVDFISKTYYGRICYLMSYNAAKSWAICMWSQRTCLEKLL